MRDQLLALTDIHAARERIAGRVHRTPAMSASGLGERVGVRLHLKAELFQKTGSFKVRGVTNKLESLSSQERSRGLVSISAGNHAAALAYGAASVGSTATIVMPAQAVQSKVDATRGYGGEVILTKRALMDECRDVQTRRDLAFVHPFDDLLIMAGHGTIGLEILEDVPDVEAVIVPIGGGGLIGGIAAAIKRQRPEVKVFGVEPVGSDAMTRSLAQGKPAHIDHSETVADGLAAPFAGEHTLRHVQEFVDEVVLVDDETILKALRLMMERAKLAAEPSGAAAFAALLGGAIKLPKGCQTVCVVSGGNVDREVLKSIL